MGRGGLDPAHVQKLVSMKEVMALVECRHELLVSESESPQSDAKGEKERTASGINKEEVHRRNLCLNKLLKTCLLCLIADDYPKCESGRSRMAIKCDFDDFTSLLLSAPSLAELNRRFSWVLIMTSTLLDLHCYMSRADLL